MAYDQREVYMKNPNELWGNDNASFVIVREYLHAMRTQQGNKAKFLRQEYSGLKLYFDFIDDEIVRNPYYDL